MLQTLQGFKVLQSLKLFDMVCRQNKTAGHASSDQDYYGDMFDKFLEMRSSSDPLRIKLVGDMVRIAGNSLCSDSSYCQKLLSNDLPDQEQITVYEKFQPYVSVFIRNPYRYLTSMKKDQRLYRSAFQNLCTDPTGRHRGRFHAARYHWPGGILEKQSQNARKRDQLFHNRGKLSHEW